MELTTAPEAPSGRWRVVAVVCLIFLILLGVSWHPPTSVLRLEEEVDIDGDHIRQSRARAVGSSRGIATAPKVTTAKTAHGQKTKPTVSRVKKVCTAPARKKGSAAATSGTIDPATLRHTGKKALVVYSVTHRSSGAVFDVEMDNLDFFARHGLLPAGLKTALFTQVDFAFQRVVLDDPKPRRKVTSCPLRTNATNGDYVSVGSESNKPEPAGHAVFTKSQNTRVFRQPKGPCDLCALSRMLRHLGIEATGSDYAFIVSLNSGARGPFFTAVDNTGPAPFTWVDHFALGGEAQFSGSMVTATAASNDIQPHIQTYSFGFPTRVLSSFGPLLSTACGFSDKRGCIVNVEVHAAKVLLHGGTSRIRSLLHNPTKPYRSLEELGEDVSNVALHPFHIRTLDPCQVVFAKFGGNMWERGGFPGSYMFDVVHQTEEQAAVEGQLPRGVAFKGSDIRSAAFGSC